MNALDEETFLRMWDTSPPRARARYRRSADASAYDPLPDLDEPRDFMARCDHCGGAFVLHGATGQAMRRYCDERCRRRAYYLRRRDELLRLKRARDERDREAVLAARRDFYRVNRGEILAYKRDEVIWKKRGAA